MADLHPRSGRVLWLDRYSEDGDTEALIARAEGVLQTGLQVHLVITGVPPVLNSLYEKHLAQIGLKHGLRYSLNINRQQIQNLLFYRGFDLLHVFQPDLFHLAAAFGRSFRLPWLASFPAGWEGGAAGHEDFAGSVCPPGAERQKECFSSSAGHATSAALALLREADAVICSCSQTLKYLQPFFPSFAEKKPPLYLIPWGVKTAGSPLSPAAPPSPQQGALYAAPPKNSHPVSQPPQQRKQHSILYAGPLKNNHLPAFQALNEVVQSRNDWILDVFSGRRPINFSGGHHPLAPAFSKILAGYTFVAGYGYLLLQALAAGKIVLLLEERYAGVFHPFNRREPVPAWRARSPAEEDDATENREFEGSPRKTIQWKLPRLATDNQGTEGRRLQDPQIPPADQQEEREGARYNPQLYCINRNIGKKRRQNPRVPYTGRNTEEKLRQDLLLLSTDRVARERLQREGWSYACENHKLAIVAEKMRCLYSRLLPGLNS